MVNSSTVIGPTATLVFRAPQTHMLSRISAAIQNLGPDDIVFGGPTVTGSGATRGIRVAAGTLVGTPERAAGEELWAVCQTGGVATVVCVREGQQ